MTELHLQLIGDGLEEVLRVEVHALLRVLRAVNANRQVLCHLARLDRVDARLLQGGAEPN